jgi:hypothetical protein
LDRVPVSFGEEFAFDVQSRYAPIVTLVARGGFHELHQPLSGRRGMCTMAALAAIILDPDVPGVSALGYGILSVLVRVRRHPVYGVFPTRLDVARQAERGFGVQGHEEFSHRRIQVFLVGIVTTGTLHFSGAIQADRPADCKGFDRACARRDKTKRMAVRESFVGSQVGSRTRRKGVRRALHKSKQPIIDGIAQGNRPIVAAQAQLGDVLRLNRLDVGH